ncbi:DUF2141 domain-containing protein [Sphingomonas sp. AOB5]|uniref:DUF2141 domain-containing protein n=1 Tax=Sphingomonas sp. AOB5 TaxID=3034017 RepID=UPI0023F673FF|nr:DUF2141 domain-containing protein [Sphingomonas sp. AOB5]MDF7777533.1 DUF2141 domain-containing protein [Sphingomonas sp. AOB5]
MAPLHSGSLDVEIVKLRSNKGMLRLCLTTDPKSFPDCKTGHAIRHSVAATTTRIHFEGLPPGTYALAVIHDENGNSKLDTMLGMPKEGFGFSRNPGIGFGPPKFKSTSFTVGTGAEQQQVRIRYLL